VDQYFTGAQIARLGVGRWLQRRAYTAERAAHLLDALLCQPAFRERAAALAAQIALEDGVATLCDALEGLLASDTRPEKGHSARV
jgi:UDP:flavonoid glycosyltransferase YjiC (YdhE family)